MHRICTTIQENGFKVTLVGKRNSNSKEFQTKKFNTKRLYCFFNKGKFFYLEFHIRLFFYLLFLKFDTLCACDMDTLGVGVFLKYLRKKPLVFDAHEYFSETSGLVGRTKEKKIWQFLERVLIPHVDKAYTVCESLAKIFSENFKIPFGVIRNVPITKHIEKSTSPFPSKTILYQGVLNKGRGLESILQVMTKIDYHLVIYGKGPLDSFLKAEVKRLNLETKVTFKGNVSPDELKNVTPHAYVGINLLEGLGFSYYYSLANKFFDYIHAGIPQINMSFPEYYALNKQYGVSLLVDSLDECALVDALKKLENQDVYNSLVQNTFKAKSELCWEIESQKLLQFYS